MLPPFCGVPWISMFKLPGMPALPHLSRLPGSDTAMCLSFSALPRAILIGDSPVPVLTQDRNTWS